uniref:Glycosyltransferase 2-like domain-containing protein n=1 Tax=viral metagenome TaxID=1070528 RepID=A0A6C0D3K4_9ZZZZ
MKLSIHYLTDDRRHFTFPHFINLLNASNKKHDWVLLILTHSNDVEFYENELKNVNINYRIARVNEDNNYLVKVDVAIQFATQNNIPYMMKCDNDIFLKAQTLDYMIDNLELLNDSAHLTIGPVLTSGIPGIEYFCDEFLDTDAQNAIKKMFLSTTFYDRDGAVYENLNKHTIGATEWNKTDFFNSVKQSEHHYKGVHPIRINTESLQYLNDYIVNNKTRFMEDNQLDIIKDNDSPYLCNSIFCIKTDTYKEIVSDHSLYVDGFEEVPLNKYAWKNNMNHLFVKNGFAIHMYYNWTPNHMDSERRFCNDFFSK